MPSPLIDALTTGHGFATVNEEHRGRLSRGER